MTEAVQPVPPDALLSGALLVLLDGAEIAVSLKELAGGTYRRINGAFAKLLGRDEEDVVGRTDAELWSPSFLATLRAAELVAIGRSSLALSDVKLEAEGASPREMRVLRLALSTGEGPPSHLVSVWMDQTTARRREAQLQLVLTQLEQQQRANDQLRRDMQDAAMRDPVTGLAARAHFEDQLRREVDLSLREHREFALVTIELDPPSEPVRQLGEPARQRVLEALGRLLRSNTRAMDASSRLDGDRFSVLLSGVGLATAHSRMEQLRRQCATQIVVLEGRELGFTVSMGVASFPHTASSQEKLLHACEEALGQARQRGGNCVALASIRFEAG